MRKLILLLIVTAICGGVGWKIYQSQSETAQTGRRGQAPVAVELGTIQQGDIEDISEFTGTLLGISEVMVSPKIAGRILSVMADLGDEMQAGQLIAALDDDEAKHAVEESKARLAVARASLEESITNLLMAQNELNRVKTLREKKIAAESELDSAQSTVSSLESRKKLADANIQQQEAALRAAESRLAYTKITSPIAGYIGKRYADEGAMVSPTSPIVQIADITKVKTVISVVEKDYSKIHVGLIARINVDAYPGREFDGAIVRISPVIDPNTRTADAEIEIENKDILLKPGMFTRVYISFGTHENAALIANRTLVKRDSKTGVFVPADDRKTAVFHELTIGLVNEDYTEVFGIDAGKEIIVTGQHLLNDGDPILLQESVKN